MVKTEFMKLLEELDSITEATDSIRTIIAEIEAGAKALLQDSPLAEDLNIDNDDIEALQMESDKDWKKSTPWIERVKTWFAEKVLNVILKNENVYKALITDQFQGNQVESYLVDITYDLQQLHWDQIEEVSLRNAAKNGTDVSGLALKVISKDNWYSQEKFFVKVLELIKSGKVKDIYEAVRVLDLALFEYQLAPKHLLESNCGLNEAITDIDLDSISTTAAEAKRLWQEVWGLERDLDKKISSAYTSNEEYKKLHAEYWELTDKLDALKRTYERREWFRVGKDDWEHDDWIDEPAYEKVKDQVEELDKLMDEIKAKLEAIKTEAKKQFDADAEVIKGKKAELETHKTTNAELTAKLKQSYPEVEAEINEVIKFLNDSDLDYAFGSDFWKASKNLFYADGRIQTTLYTELTCDGDRFEPDDFNSSGELTERSEKWEAQSMIDDAGASAEGIGPYMELEESEDGWYKIPGSDWELCKRPEYDYDVEDLPTIWYDGDYEDYDDYEINGEFKISANIYLGKKVKK